jgi:LacI family transcriptional regulator
MTVKEIAALAGVSIGTVDRVIYRRGRVAIETKARIEAVIEKYQFTPNPIARRLKRNRAYNFCALIPRRDQDAGYWDQALGGIEGALEEIRLLGVNTEIVEFDRYDVRAFQSAAKKALAKKPDGMVFAPIMPDKTSAFIRTVESKGIPYVFFDADIPEMKPLCAIGQDPFRGGYLAGRLMHLFTGKKSKKPAVVLDAHGEDYHIARRRDGFLRYAKERRLPVITQEYSNYRGSELSEDEILEFLGAHHDISGVFITNCLAHRVTGAAEKAGRGGEFVIIGYDLIPNNRLLLQNGGIDAIISQRPEYQGRLAVMTLYRRLVLEQTTPGRVEIPLDVYLQENVPIEG